MSSTMSGYSPILNAERGSLNAELFKWSIRHPDLSGPFKLLNADMSSTMSGYSPFLNAERRTLNAELFKWSIRHPDLSGLFKLLNADMSSTMSGCSPILNAERGTLNTELFKLQTLQMEYSTSRCIGTLLTASTSLPPSVSSS